MTTTDFGLGAVGGNVTVASLLYPGLSQLIVQTAMPKLIGRQVLQHYASPNYPIVTIPIQGGSGTAVANRVAEGTDIPIDVRPITATSLYTYKIGRGHTISDELIRYAQIPVIQQRMIDLGLIMGNTVDIDCIAVISAGAASANAVTASGKSLGTNGTEFQRFGTVGQYDIVDAISLIRQSNYEPDTLMVNPIGFSMLAKLPMFSSALMFGEPGYRTGARGSIEGLDVLVSQNVTSGEMYVMASGADQTALGGQYSPAGYFVESAPLTSFVQYNGQKMQQEVFAYQIYVPAITKGAAISKISYTGTS